MSTRLDALAREKEILVTRSALCRLRLQRRAGDARAALPWNRAASAVASVPTLARTALGLALLVAGVGRTSQLVTLAGRIVLAAKLARPVIAFARGLAKPSACGIEQTTPTADR